MYRHINIIVYPTQDDTTRIEYKNHIIQIYGYNNHEPDAKIMHFIIDEFGNDLVERDCLVKCINYIDGRVRRKKDE